MFPLKIKKKKKIFLDPTNIDRIADQPLEEH